MKKLLIVSLLVVGAHSCAMHRALRLGANLGGVRRISSTTAPSRIIPVTCPEDEARAKENQQDKAWRRAARAATILQALSTQELPNSQHAIWDAVRHECLHKIVKVVPTKEKK